MFRDLLFKGRGLADRVKNIVMDYTTIEAKVREATNDDQCLPSSNILSEISAFTFRFNGCLEVIKVLVKRMKPTNSKCWRRVYKSLLVMDYLLLNGSEQIVQVAREHIIDIRSLESYRFCDENGKDQGLNVRIRVKRIVDLLQDSDLLHQEREQAKSIRHHFDSSSCGGYSLSRESLHCNSGDRKDFDRQLSIKPKINWQADNWPGNYQPKSLERPKAQPNLGRFDDWNVGKERGMTDEIIDQFREAWDLTKLSTRDLFNNRQSDFSFNETNPNMVSEEVYEFPSYAVQLDQTYSMDSIERISSGTERFSFSMKKPTESIDAKKSEAKPIQTGLRNPQSVQSGNLIDYFDVTPNDTSNGNKNTHGQPSLDLFDMVSFDSEIKTGGLQSMPSNCLKDSQRSSRMGPVQSPSSNVVDLFSLSNNNKEENLLDMEFGEFAKASVGNLTQPLPVQNLLPQVYMNGAKVSEQQPCLDLFNQMLTPVSGSSVTSSIQPNDLPISKTTTTIENNFGETWKDLSSLNIINLDSLTRSAMPSAKVASPSLLELQQQKREMLSATNI